MNLFWNFWEGLVGTTMRNWNYTVKLTYLRKRLGGGFGIRPRAGWIVRFPGQSFLHALFGFKNTKKRGLATGEPFWQDQSR